MNVEMFSKTKNPYIFLCFIHNHWLQIFIIFTTKLQLNHIHGTAWYTSVDMYFQYNLQLCYLNTILETV